MPARIYRTETFQPGDLVRRWTGQEDDKLMYYLVLLVDEGLVMLYLGDSQRGIERLSFRHFDWNCIVWRDGEEL